MISVDTFDSGPVVAGDVRKLVLSGDGPFRIAPRCFIDKPKPPGPGFLPCPECSVQIVSAGELAEIAISSDLWSGKEGVLIIDISNQSGDSIKLSIEVQSDIDSTPTAIATS